MRTAAQTEAIEVADANLNNVDLPLYGELLDALQRVVTFYGVDIQPEHRNEIRALIHRAHGA